MYSPAAGNFGTSAYLMEQLERIAGKASASFATWPSLACLITTSTSGAAGQRLVPVRDLAQDRLAEIPEAADHHLHRTVAGRR